MKLFKKYTASFYSPYTTQEASEIIAGFSAVRNNYTISDVTNRKDVYSSVILVSSDTPFKYNSFLPKISLLVEEEAEQTVVSLLFELKKFVKVFVVLFMIFALIFESSLLFAFIKDGVISSQPGLLVALILPIVMVLFMIGLCYSGFRSASMNELKTFFRELGDEGERMPLLERI